MPSRFEKHDWRFLLPGLVGVVVLFATAWYHRGTVDDAFISFRYLDNWLTGQGLVFNPGERVEGYSNLLWIVLLAPLRASGLEPETAAGLLALLALSTTALACTRTALRTLSAPGMSSAVLALLAGAAPLAAWTFTGMETTLYAALLTLAAWRIAVVERFDAGAGVLFGLAALTRPEGLWVGLAVFAVIVVREIRGISSRWRSWIVGMGALVALPAAQLGLRLIYYGSPLPNTYFAKLGNLAVAAMIVEGGAYSFRFLTDGGLLLVAVATLAFSRRIAVGPAVLALWAEVVALAAFAIRVGGDYFPFYRFLAPALPALVILAAVGLGSLKCSVRTGRFRSWLPWSGLGIGLLSLVFWAVSSNWVAMGHDAGVGRSRQRLADWITSEAKEGDVLAVNVAGLIPYRTRLATIDMLGLTDATIARSAAAPDVGGYSFTGHRKHDAAYVCSRAPRFVVPGGAGVRIGRSPEEAATQTLLNSFPGDRDFLQTCGSRYERKAIAVGPTEYLVVLVRRAEDDAAPSSPRPRTAEKWFEEGVRRLSSGDPAAAAEAFRSSLAIAPAVSAARVNLGFALLDSGRLPEARAEFTALVSLESPPSEAYFGLALCAELEGETEEAAALWRRFLAEAADSPWAGRARDHLRLLGED